MVPFLVQNVEFLYALGYNWVRFSQSKHFGLLVKQIKIEDQKWSCHYNRVTENKIR